MNKILKYEQYNESLIWDKIKDKFRSEDNPNVIAEELFNKAKKDVMENLDVLSSVEYEDGVLFLELSNKLKIKIILIKDETGEGDSGYIWLKPFRKKEIELDVEYDRTERFVNWILSKKEKYKVKSDRKKVSKDIRNVIKNI